MLNAKYKACSSKKVINYDSFFIFGYACTLYTHVIDIIPVSGSSRWADAGSWAAGHVIQIPEYKSGQCS